jgi:hypothetical protein
MEGNQEYLLGECMPKLHTYLQDYCNPDSPYVLHYVTAREAYNIAMAAAAGAQGDPGQYRDYLIPPYANRYIFSDLPYRLERYSPKTWSLAIIHPGKTTLQVKGDVSIILTGDYIARSDLVWQEEGQLTLQVEGKDQVEGRITLPKPDPFRASPRVLEGEFEVLKWDEDGQMFFKGLCSSQGRLVMNWRPGESKLGE